MKTIVETLISRFETNLVKVSQGDRIPLRWEQTIVAEQDWICDDFKSETSCRKLGRLEIKLLFQVYLQLSDPGRIRRYISVGNIERIMLKRLILFALLLLTCTGRWMFSLKRHISAQVKFGWRVMRTNEIPMFLLFFMIGPRLSAFWRPPWPRSQIVRLAGAHRVDGLVEWGENATTLFTCNFRVLNGWPSRGEEHSYLSLIEDTSLPFCTLDDNF